MLTKTNEYNQYLLSGLTFTFISSVFTKFYKNDKLGRNVSSFLHATTSSSLSLLVLLLRSNSLDTTLLESFIRSLCTGYFLYDTLITLKYQKGIMRIAYTYHHLASLLLLDQNSNIFPIHEILFLAEASNIPSNFVYYHIKQKSKDYIVTRWKNIQKYIYLFIRIPFLGAVSYKYYDLMKYNNNNLIKFYLMCPVYFMGVFWSYKLFNN